ncbi:gamma-interferon-inducible-lysosomal thiol reductase-like [Venturia canescens]|uniref:gamma-interferon-inducible-lysosomal thiol reductase-like n=1 Tax=Venturia canescens TaxID=32260 RepID=UPI001C9CBF2E|nr:gamma-interferon-inducible-lysosomal thiol reductase-like [Venturia canescens]
MTFTLAATAFVLILTHPTLGLGPDEKTVLNVTVYYEALCGDSIRFVNQQLAPSYEGLKEHLKIDFVPYGKAEQSRNEKTGEWSFDCQHGPDECKGNRDQACALDAINKNEDAAKRQDLSVNLVACVMSSTNPATAVTRCAKTVKLSVETQKLLGECQESRTANELLAQHGVTTMRLNPILTFVPTITVNGQAETEARNHFRRFVCGQIPDNEKPDSCKST